MTKMIKQPTGKKYKPADFRKLNQCVYCGLAQLISEGEACEPCKAKNYKNCECCEAVLRKGTYKVYTYDTREIHRDGRVDFNPIKELVKEFVSDEKPYHEQWSETLCVGCINWFEKVRNVCWMCENDFENTLQNYKLNGNVCGHCSRDIEVTNESISQNN